MTLSPASSFARTFGLLVFLAGAAIPLAGARAIEATAEQRAACTPDAFRLCSAEIPDEARVAQCMIANKSRLSARCLASFRPTNPRQFREARRFRRSGRGPRDFVVRHQFARAGGFASRDYRVDCEEPVVLGLCNSSGNMSPSPAVCAHYRGCYYSWP